MQCSRDSPLAGSVRISSAPKALSRILRSRDMDAGMVSTNLYPLAAAMKARPMPVLPDVGSTSVVCREHRQACDLSFTAMHAGLHLACSAHCLTVVLNAKAMSVLPDVGSTREVCSRHRQAICSVLCRLSVRRALWKQPL